MGLKLRHIAVAVAVVGAPFVPAQEALAGGDYDLTLTWVDRSGQLRVAGRWRLPTLAEDIGIFQFYLTPFAKRLQVQALCGRRSRSVASLTSTEDGGDYRWHAALDEPCAKGQTLELLFQYAFEEPTAPQLRANAAEGFAGSSGELWYPQAAYSDREKGSITLDLPERLTGVATGALASVRRSGGRKRTTFVAKAPAKFAFAYGAYRVERSSDARGVAVYTRSPGIDVRVIAGTANRAHEVLARAFGELPAAELRIVEVDFRSLVIGTSEYGMLFVDPSQLRDAQHRLAYWGHELSHQWWGGLVRAKAGAPGSTMLTEGMAQYGTLIAIEELEGRAAAAAYRRDGDRASSITGYRTLARDGRDFALGTTTPSSQEETLSLHRLATSKGAIAVNLFAEKVGRAAFHGALKAFLVAHAGKATTWRDFSESFVARFGEPAQRFFRQWFERPGAPTFEVKWQGTATGVDVIVQQTSLPYELGLPIDLVGGAGVRRVVVDVSTETTRVHIDRIAGVTQLNVDPEATIPTAGITVVPMR